MRTPEEFLQFLYDQNVLCFIEDTIDEKFIRWCFRERSPSNISPKVKAGLVYEIHYGLANTINTGKSINPASKSKGNDRHFGKIRFVDIVKKFGFIEEPGLPVDIHFKFSDCNNKDGLRPGREVSYKLKKGQEGRLSAYDIALR